MQVKLRVCNGSNEGKVVKVSSKEFIIGRKEGCQLRPRSDLVSRKHCMIQVSTSKVIVRDLGSRNGTFVNDNRIESDCELKLGDRLKVGKLEFEVLIDQGLGGIKKPKVEGVQEAAVRTAQTPAASVPADAGEDFDITNWLSEADAVELEQRQAEPDTRQFKLDETDRVTLDHSSQAIENTVADNKAETADDTKIIKKKPGKLPLPKVQTENSRAAAAEALKNFFNRR